jgi:archaemetzincin
MNAIHLLPLGNVDHDLLHAMAQPLGRAYHAEVSVITQALSLDSFYDEQRNQFNSTAILLSLKRQIALRPSAMHAGKPVSHRHPHTNIYLGIAADDLFIPVLTYVFGEAELGGNVAVASYYRLQNELYGLPANRDLLTERLLKEAMHEVGHAFGLRHCSSIECVMRTSTYVEDIDLKPPSLCSLCAQRISLADGWLGSNVQQF